MINDKTQIAILICATTGQSGTGILAGVPMVIANAIGLSIYNIKKLNK